MSGFKGWLAAGMLLAGVSAFTGCNGGGSSQGQVRLINATRSHVSLDLLSGSTRVISAVAPNAASSYAGVDSGSATLQVVDNGSSTTLLTSGPTITADQSYSLITYESGGTLKSAWLAENDTTPTSGTAQLRIVDLAPDAGALDVHVTGADTVLTSASVPSFTLAASTGLQSTVLMSFTPGTYRVRVTAAGNVADVRGDMAQVTLGDQKVVQLVLTPTLGGGLVDMATLVEKGAYSTTPNANARVRLVSGVAGGTVAAAAGTTLVEAGAVSPTIGSYVTVPAGAATWAVTVDGVAAAVPPVTLAAGSDSTLLVTGSAAAAQAVLLADDNHAPALSTNDHMRIVNGLAGSSAGLSLTVDFALLASNVTPGTASAYKTVAANAALRLQVDSPLSATPLSLQTGLNVTGGGVFSVFVLGDAAAPVTVLRRDR